MAKTRTLKAVKFVWGELEYPAELTEQEAVQKYKDFDIDVKWGEDEVMISESVPELSPEKVAKVFREHQIMKSLVAPLVEIVSGYHNRFGSMMDADEVAKTEELMNNCMEVINTTEKVEKDNTKEITEYMVETLNFLDGQGIIFTDEELVRTALKEMGNFSNLKKIVK